jgi:metal-responsive CopG/Arc/MetJ family transcriptional regulator
MATGTRIVLRLPDHLVTFLDDQIVLGESSRAAVVLKAVISYQHEKSIERGAEIHRTQGDADEWDLAMQRRPEGRHE